MIRGTVFFFTLALAGFATAQSWCPPGAKWHFTSGGYLFEGPLVRTYVGDTVIGGRTAQILADSGYHISTFSGEPVLLPIHDRHYTSLEDGLLLIWTSFEWDTLLRFDAEPGDRWYPPGNSIAVCGEHPSGMYQVVDTSTLLIKGIPLRSFLMDGVLEDGTLIGGPYIEYHERFGLVPGLQIAPWCIMDAGSEQLRCYSDDQIAYVSPEWSGPCDLGMSVDHEHLVPISIHPNPGTDHFTLALPPGDHEMQIFDRLGRSVMAMDRISDRAVIGTTSLPPGVYTIRITDRNGRTFHKNWIKE